MTTSNITPIAIFTDLCDGYSADRLADKISHTDRDTGVAIAQAALKTISLANPTKADQKAAHTALDYIYGGDSASDLVNDHAVDADDADAYMAVIHSDYNL